MSRRLFSVLVLLAFDLHTALCTVRCYSCSSKQNPDCFRPEQNKISLMKCDMEALERTKRYAEDVDFAYSKIFEVDRIDAGRMDLTCLKVVTKVGHKNYVIRGCQLAEQSHLDICRKIQQHNSQMLEMIHCSKCSIDHCNTSDKLNINIFVLFVTAFVYKVFYMTE